MRHTIVPRAEYVLIVVICAGLLLIVQTWNFALYQIGLLTMMAATLLNIAVANLPRGASPARALALTVGILVLVVFVFGLGILLVPYFARLGS